jgi:hypothetical protein
MCALTAVAPIVRFNAFDILVTPTFLRASDFNSRTSDEVHARLTDFFFFISIPVSVYENRASNTSFRLINRRNVSQSRRFSFILSWKQTVLSHDEAAANGLSKTEDGVLELVCRELPHAGHHEERKYIAERLIRCAGSGRKTLEDLQTVARRALLDLLHKKPA